MKKLFVIFMSTLMISCFIPTMAFAGDNPAEQTPGITEGTEEETTEETDSATGKIITLSGSKWEIGTYDDYKVEKAKYNKKITLNANVTAVTLRNVSDVYSITICEGSSITFTLEGANKVDYIYGEGENTNMTFGGDGSLTGVHIGGLTSGKIGCNITINSGEFVIDSSSKQRGWAAIGGAIETTSSGEITINGGNVTATANYGAAIGGGQKGAANKITITGGTITATSMYGAAIGGGQNSRDNPKSVSAILITGGTVNATSNSYGAAIGGGQYSTVESIQISGGTVTATGDYRLYGAAIGSGQYGAVKSILITGGTINATNDNYRCAVIGAGQYGRTEEIKITGGNITTNVKPANGTHIWANNVFISGGNFAGNITSSSQEVPKYHVYADKKSSITGGRFVNDALSSKCAAGYEMVAEEYKVQETETTYDYKVVPITIEEETVSSATIADDTKAGETAGKVSDQVAADKQDTAAAVANSVTTTGESTTGDNDALINAAEKVNVQNDDEVREAAIRALIEDEQIKVVEDSTGGAEATKIVKVDDEEANVTITLIKEPYLDVEVKSLTVDGDSGGIEATKELTMEITPKYNLLATTEENPADTTNAVTVSTGHDLTVTDETTLTVQLPDGFVDSTDTSVYVKHNKNNDTAYIYTATVTEGTEANNGKYYATFTNPHGFSEFIFTVKNPAVATIGSNNYATLQAAVDAARDGATITVKDGGTPNSLTATMAGGGTRTIKIENGTSDEITVTMDGTEKTLAAQATESFTYIAPSHSGRYHKTVDTTADDTKTDTKEDTQQDTAAQIAKVKELAGKIQLKARSVKTAKGNIKVRLKITKGADSFKALEDMGYTLKYQFYRSTEMRKNYKYKFETLGAPYTNTDAKKGTRYYYKARIMVYNEEGNLITKTNLKKCWYATRIK